MSAHKTIILGSRGSDLALWQANHVKKQLADLGHNSEIKIIKTSGDQIQHLSFDKMEGKGFFTKEIEEALLNHEIDFAVHSHKDLETKGPEGLCIAAVSKRADVRDLLLLNKSKFENAGQLPDLNGILTGTSSARRKAMLLHHFPSVQLQDLRGNVPTRIQKLREGKYDAILLAKAGLDRLNLNLSEFISIPLDPTQFVPAPAQGVLAIQARKTDLDLLAILQKLNDAPTRAMITAERTVLSMIGGGCQVPLGAYCEQIKDGYTLHVAYAQSWDSKMNYYTESGPEPMNLATSIGDSIKNIQR